MVNNFRYLIAATTLIFLSFSTYFVLSKDAFLSMTVEDGPFESTGALLFLVTSFSFFILYRKDIQNNQHYIFKFKRNLFYLPFAFIFLLGFLEEISWGQRILGIATPEVFEQINVQKEINIHNISIFHRVAQNEVKSGWELFLNIDRLFSLFWFTFCCGIPLIYIVNKRANNFINKISFPKPPLALGLVFFLNYAMSKILEMNIQASVQPLTEIKEFNFALLFFIVSLWFLQNREISINISIQQQPKKQSFSSVSRLSVFLRQMTNIFF